MDVCFQVSKRITSNIYRSRMNVLQYAHVGIQQYYCMQIIQIQHLPEIRAEFILFFWLT